MNADDVVLTVRGTLVAFKAAVEQRFVAVFCATRPECVLTEIIGVQIPSITRDLPSLFSFVPLSHETMDSDLAVRLLLADSHCSICPQ